MPQTRAPGTCNLLIFKNRALARARSKLNWPNFNTLLWRPAKTPKSANSSAGVASGELRGRILNISLPCRGKFVFHYKTAAGSVIFSSDRKRHVSGFIAKVAQTLQNRGAAKGPKGGGPEGGNPPFLVVLNLPDPCSHVLGLLPPLSFCIYFLAKASNCVVQRCQILRF